MLCECNACLQLYCYAKAKPLLEIKSHSSQHEHGMLYTVQHQVAFVKLVLRYVTSTHQQEHNCTSSLCFYVKVVFHHCRPEFTEVYSDYL